MQRSDYLIIGAGIAGASLAYHLAPAGKTIMLEREEQPGYHSTGRSAAIHIETHGPRLIRVMTKVSGVFLRNPPAGFSDVPLLTALGALFVANADQIGTLDAFVTEMQELSDTVERIDAARTLELAPILRADYVAGAVYDSAAMDMDVNAIHMGYLRGARADGLELVTNAPVEAAERRGGLWRLTTPVGEFAAPIVINAAGAWADTVATLAGVRTVGLVPKRRTAIVVDAPTWATLSEWCAVADCQEQWYYKPDAGQVLASPADATPVPPQDVQPEELDIAVLVDRLETATTLDIGRINRAWAGLRSFVADGCPVVGFAPDADGFFWLAGQGGYGIETSYAMGMSAAALLTGQALPAEIADFGVRESDLAAQRLWPSP